MIVYGDSQHQDTFSSLCQQVENRIEAFLLNVSLDMIRTLLCLCGQFEQAVQDHRHSDSIQRLTDAAAQSFYQVWSGEKSIDLQPLMAELASLKELPEQNLTLRDPEGFAHYALYPEQYIVSAQAWAQENHNHQQEVLIIGLRSIGTTLSSLVKATLNASGWQAQRLTVRPHGSPFERLVALPVSHITPNTKVLIVDEGPGFSGSSMAASAEAAVKAGGSRENIAFLPGHSGVPGQAGNETVQKWWETTPRYSASPNELRWDGQTLQQALGTYTTKLLGQPFRTIEDFGGGLWRREIYPKSADFPAVNSVLEPPKFRVTCSRQAVLWKFAGLALGSSNETGAEAAFTQMKARAAGGWSPAPLGIHQGFVALPWIDGRPLSREDFSPTLLNHIGSYLAATAGALLKPKEQIESLCRLEEMLYWNTWEACGEELAEKTRRWAAMAREVAEQKSFPRYSDGRMAPYEWIQDADNRIWKVDNTGHTTDHTAIGEQSLAWDVAGTIIEWDLNDEPRALLLAYLSREERLSLEVDFLTFHCLAYAAFRLGLLTMATFSLHDSEQARLQSAIGFYRSWLQRLL